MTSRVVHTVAGLSPGYGGPTRTVLALAGALAAARAAAEVRVLTMREAAAIDTSPAAPAQVVAVPATGALSRGLRYGSEFSASLSRLAAGDRSVIHDHGLWLPTNHAAARVARRLGVARIVSPRGMLAPWALAHRRLRKRIAWALYQRRDLRDASALQAASEAEALEFRRVGLRLPIAIVPNGVALPALPASAREPVPRRALALCRLHPVKGLDGLLRAWARSDTEGWELHIAGPDEDGYGEALRRQARELGIAGSVQFVGELDETRKWAFLRSGQLFVLPSVSESFSMATAEALAAGLPVLTTTAVPWPWLEQWGCGWRAPPGAEGLAPLLQQALSTSAGRLAEMGAAGALHVQEHFAWRAVAQRQWQVYDWLFGAGRPSFVTKD